jgi:hypothetical protein
MTDLQLPDTPAPPADTPEQAHAKPRDRRALSAYRHGLTGQIVLLTAAEQLAYAEHCEGYVESLKPEDYVQRNLVKLVANDRWLEESGAKLASAIAALQLQPETQTTGDPEIDAALSDARGWIEKGNSLALLSLYQGRTQRRIEKNMAELRKLKAESRAHQAEKDAKLQNALEDARVLCRAAPEDSEAAIPIIERVFANFDFSTEEAVGRVAGYLNLWEAHARHGSVKNLLKRAA